MLYHNVNIKISHCIVFSNINDIPYLYIVFDYY